MNRALFLILILILILIVIACGGLRLRLGLGLREGSRAQSATKIRGGLSMNRSKWPMSNGREVCARAIHVSRRPLHKVTNGAFLPPRRGNHTPAQGNALG